MTNEDIETEAFGVKQQRMQNLAFTIDKIKYVLRNQPSQIQRIQSPLRKLTKNEILDRLWNKATPLVNILLKYIRIHVIKGTDNINATYIDEIDDLIQKQ
eukprot:329331_1